MLKHTWSDKYLLYYKKRMNSITVNMLYIAVANRFNRTEITYIQVTLPNYLKHAIDKDCKLDDSYNAQADYSNSYD